LAGSIESKLYQTRTKFHPAAWHGASSRCFPKLGSQEQTFYFHPKGFPPTEEKGCGVGGAENLPATC